GGDARRGPLDRVRAVGAAVLPTGGAAAGDGEAGGLVRRVLPVRRPGVRAQLLLRRSGPGDHDPADHDGDHPGGVRRRADRRTARRLWPGRHPGRGDPEGAAAPQLLGHRRRCHAGAGPGDRRNGGGGDASRRFPAHGVQPVLRRRHHGGSHLQHLPGRTTGDRAWLDGDRGSAVRVYVRHQCARPVAGLASGAQHEGRCCMTALDTSPTTPAPRRSLREIDARTRRRQLASTAMRVVLTAVMAVAVLPLLLILYVVIERGWSVISLQFFTEDTLPFRMDGGGFRQGFVGSFLIMLLAIPMAIIPGVATAVYLVEYGKGKKLAALVRFVTDVMTGVPSIFVGLFVYAAVVIGTIRLGFGTLAAAIAIAIVMLPIVVRSIEEMLKLVPDHLRSAALGLGARRWQTTVKVVLPAAAPGLATGSMLAVARGAGETAPL